MDLTLEQIKTLVYDARRTPNASFAELLATFLPKKQTFTIKESIIEITNNRAGFDGITFHKACKAFLIYRSLESGDVDILKNKFGTYGLVTREKLDKEIENIKILLNLT